MIDHTGISVPKDKFDETIKFYLAALEPLGYKKLMEIGGAGVGIGPSKMEMDFWIVGDDSRGHVYEHGKGIHTAFRAQTHEQVDAFHAAGLKTGATCNGKPGFRKEYHPFFYGAFLYDPVGNNIEVVCHDPEEAGKKGEDVAAGLAWMAQDAAK